MKEQPLLNRARCAVLALLCLAAPAAQAAGPRVAVTDLGYEVQVSEYFRNVSASQQFSQHGRQASGSSSFTLEEGTKTYIVPGELRNFTADIKGALVRGGKVRVVQGRPHTGKASENVHDIIARIRVGAFPGADYVLFGTVSDIQFSEGEMGFDAGSRAYTLQLDLVADFSLINTRNYEIVAAFSAAGSGLDSKILSRAGDRASLNRAKVVRETSQSLAEEVYEQLIGQFTQAGAAITFEAPLPPARPVAPAAPEAPRSGVTVY
ncbi:hypothetical protein [Kerstersia gyiorum]|uniref:Curli biogenesis system outer membrane secretion channel CsgG n=1 Tax=Kerstersia gyiorum TaxID=206506 RepID=A0A171KQH0_9BURK|nr:hypothetical protein [Kerstersia gyiorum]MCO7641852.1 penicillin-binding protein activator LpoB [Pseudomonas sp. S 311-6]KAB0543938.1 penicillin-binding protein activator LpoB [Kerstersia gyiorum]KKO71137.1 hypothetical protein AAV32_12790 [Kerstersia gyiorum]MCP1631655.1 curli biogenesis system outer membrane secretion channel CsgG [Kerstersia gyiorum]MCP1636683.1 curli biogenesis system outer membrane secretion channel CsgG [Kerstersia gyiorum]